MSEHEAELRRRLAAEGANIYDVMRWFLDAIGAQACADGGPEPELSWFEREFLGTTSSTAKSSTSGE